MTSWIIHVCATVKMDFTAPKFHCNNLSVAELTGFNRINKSVWKLVTDGRIVERYGVHEVMSLMIPGESVVLRGIMILFAHVFFWNSEIKCLHN